MFNRKPLPQPPNFNETPINDKPHGIASNPPLGPTQIRTATRRYHCRLGSLLAVDDGVKRIVKALRHKGELDNTLIIYTSDNGFFSGEHRITTGKNRVYEEGIRVPLLMRGPGIPEGVKVDDLAINPDLAPTIVDAAGATAGRTEDGVSLIRAAKHPDRLSGRRLLLEQLTTTPDDDGQPGVTYTAVRTARYKYVLNGTGEVELYDLRSDPYELQNQHSNPAYDAVESALAADLAQLRNCSGASCKAKPALHLKLPHEKRSGGRSCRQAKHFVARVRGADTKSVTKLTFRVGPKGAGHDHAEPLRKKLKARLLRSKRRPQIRAIADLLDGRRVSMQRRVRIC